MSLGYPAQYASDPSEKIEAYVGLFRHVRDLE